MFVAKKGAAAKPAKAAKADKPLGETGHMPVDEHAEVIDAKVAKDGSIKGTGKFEVVEISAGKFRMFNEVGQAVSPVVADGDTNERGVPMRTVLTRQAARSNALNKGRQVRTPAGHEEAK